MDIRTRTDFRVIAEGDDAVGRDLTLAQAIGLLDVARRRGKRFLSIVDDTTGAIVDERKARAWLRRLPPPLPGDSLVPCPSCEDEGGMPTGDVLVQLPSGTWIRDTCTLCQGRKWVPRDVARSEAQVEDESTADGEGGQRIPSGTRPRVARVLVVHDEPTFAEGLRAALADEFSVTVANARQALTSMMAGDWYDVVLCKLMMPGRNGAELRHRVNATSPEQAARFVFMDEQVDVHGLCEKVRRLTSPSEDSVVTAIASRR